MKPLRRPLRSHPCPHCGRNRVWSTTRADWRCPDCNWSTGQRVAREEAINASVEAHRAGIERPSYDDRWRP